MKLVSFLRSNASPGVGLGGLPDGAVLDLQAVDPTLPTEMRAFLERGEQALDAARRAEEAARNRPDAVLARGHYRLRPVVPDPSKFLLMGLNYRAHVLEGGREIPDKPVLFARFAQSLIAAGEPIVVPRVSERVDWEGELVCVIGKGGRHIPEERALEHVAGYTCFNDVSVRDWQHMGTPAQWMLGKNFDSSGPLGPWLVTADEIPDPATMELRTLVNGQQMQAGHTSDLIFSVPYLVALVSQAMELRPGDLISTGTPGGVGNARKPPVYLKDGDTVTVHIDRIGELTNPVRNEA